MKSRFFTYVTLVTLFLFLFTFTACTPDYALGESRTEKIGIYSLVLGKMMTIEIHMPRGYDDEKSYPVLYMLHGYGEKESNIRSSGFFNMADIFTEQDLIEPMIIVVPQMDNSYLLNSSQKTVMSSYDELKAIFSGMYEDYFIKEVIGYIESTYNVIESREGRYLGGKSTGGYAALRLAFTNPELFSKVGGHMPAIWTPQMELMKMDLINWFYPNDIARSERELTSVAKSYNLNELAIYIDCGESDWYSQPIAEELKTVLDEQGYEYEFVLNTGKHENSYFQEHISEYLKFYGGVN